MARVLVIGGAVVDVSLCPVDAGIFSSPSTAVDCIPLSTGGDAMNEASVLTKLGTETELCTLLGADDAGQFILSRCRERGIGTTWCVVDPSVVTSVNVVLVDGAGERRFVTAQNSSLRRLSLEHIEPVLERLTCGMIVSLASIFVSLALDIDAMKRIFKRIHEAGCVLCADMTRCKHGETADDMQDVLSFVDYLFCNQEEGTCLTHQTTLETIADDLLRYVPGHVIVKLGACGCLDASQEGKKYYPAVKTRVLDTTGAGDTFAGAVIHGLSHGLPWADCLRLGNAAAGVTIQYRGAASERLSHEAIEENLTKIS